MIKTHSLLPNQYKPISFTGKTETSSNVLANTTVNTNNSLNIDHLKANFLSFSALKKNNCVSFTSKDKPAFNPKDVEAMKQEVDKCKYVLDVDNLVNSKDFKVICKEDKIKLKNMTSDTPTGEKVFLGINENLARNMLHHLKEMNNNKEFKKQYVFELVSGNDNSYFYEGWDHTYILCWPKNKDEKTRKRLERKPTEFPKGVLVIDPSSNTVGFPGKGLAGYKLKGLAKKTKPSEVLKFDYNGYTTGTPLGRMKYLNPEHMEEDAIVCLAFTKKPNRATPKVNLYIQREPDDDCVFWINWKNEVEPDSPLMKIIERVRSDIQKQFES